MTGRWIVAAMVALPALLLAQNGLPVGTIVPVSLSEDLNAARLRPGQEIRARVMQNIPGTKVQRGTEVIGHVSNVSSSKDGLVRIEFSFDAMNNRGQLIPMTTGIRALASPPEITDAESSMYGPSDGIDSAHESTTQIGSGDLVFHGGGPVFDGPIQIGKSTQDGVLVEPHPNLELHCRGMVGDASKVQAFWLFSSDACGVYGFQNIRIAHAGRTDPKGTIVLVADGGKLNINSQSGLLLRVLASQESNSEGAGRTALAEQN